MKRTAGTRELIDGPIDTLELEGNLRDLTRFNRWLGGARLSWRALRSALAATPRPAAGDPIELLDVGTGAADIPRDLLRRSRRAPPGLRITATDVRPEVVASARARSEGVADLVVELAQAGVVGLPDNAFDVVHCSLVVHHLEPEQACNLLAGMGRVARLAVIVNDLDRARRWWLVAWLLSRLATGNRYTRHDGPLSVRRAYRADEVAQLAASAGLRPIARHSALFGHRYSIAFAPPVGRDG